MIGYGPLSLLLGSVVVPWGVLGFVVRAIIKGDLVPRRSVEALLTLNDKREEQMRELAEPLSLAVQFIHTATRAREDDET